MNTDLLTISEAAEMLRVRLGLCGTGARLAKGLRAYASDDGCFIAAKMSERNSTLHSRDDGTRRGSANTSTNKR